MNVWLVLPLLVASLVGCWQVPFFRRDYGANSEQLSCERDDLFLTTPEFITRNNYTSESHLVETSDGYLLTLHRIGQSMIVHGRPVIFLMHCIIASSSIWVLYGRNNSLAFKLVDAGYDVWMGNARGNLYSRAHCTLNTDGAEYWSFSWHEIGIYDLPASIDYVLAKTGQTQLQYIGYSMGTTVFYVMMAERPEYNDKVKVMQAWGPVAYMSHIDAPNLSNFLQYTDQIEKFLRFFNIYEFSPTNLFVSKAIQLACFGEPSAYVSNLCVKALIMLFTIDPGDTEPEVLPLLFGQLPAGTSIKQLIHYGQVIRNKKFAQFDHGPADNRRIYGQTTPPEYNLKRITVPVISYLGSSDNMATKDDCQRLDLSFQHHVVVDVNATNFNHLSFLIAPNLDEILHRNVLAVVQKFDPIAEN